jgi:NIPSNAP
MISFETVKTTRKYLAPAFFISALGVVKSVTPEPIGERQMQSSAPCCPVVELRQYTLHPGKRDVLIDLFDREFVETQEALGVKIIGQFRDLDHPDRFVWLRGFRDMPSRAKALNDFYGGPVWKTHREAANATMIDSDNVLLLRPALPTSGFSLENMKRPPVGSDEVPTSLVVATIYYFADPITPDFINFFEHMLRPVAASLGATIPAYFVTEIAKTLSQLCRCARARMCLSGSRPFRIWRPTRITWLLSRDRNSGAARSRPH